jgi:NAD(P)-dependent dehydrogenase (short-subunit alcohol dehydrogenase family)
MTNRKIVVVTGASAGIGEATVRLLSQSGFEVFGGVRDLARAPEIASVRFGRVDVTDEASVSAFVAWVLAETGRIDVLVNNAGVSLVGPVENTSTAEAQQVFDTNVFGPLRMIRSVLPSMRAARSGLIINISSVLGFLPAPFMGIYASSKHALEGLSESLDHEVPEYNVRVVLIEPTFTRTSLDVNARHTQLPLGVYEAQVAETTKAVVGQIKSAPEASVVARQIVAAIDGPYRLRQPVGGNAKLLSKLRRFMPASAVDGSLRKTFGFGKRTPS